jgi:hypothetical protein
VLRVALAVGLAPASIAAQPAANPTAGALNESNVRLKEYVALHPKLANETGEIDETKNPREIADREPTLGQLIRARP